jgi:MFS family permease
VRARETSLSPLARRLVSGQLFIGIGYGLITPSWFLYLDDVRGFGATVAGFSFTLRAIGMIVTVPLAGWLIDRRGPRGAVLAGTVCTITGAAGLGLSQGACSSGPEPPSPSPPPAWCYSTPSRPHNAPRPPPRVSPCGISVWVSEAWPAALSPIHATY